MNLPTEVLKILLPALGASGITGLIGAYFVYRGNRPEVLAKARQINVTAEVTITEQWKAWAEKMESKVADLEITIKENQKNYQITLLEKDKEIDKLKQRVNSLEDELQKYKNART